MEGGEIAGQHPNRMHEERERRQLFTLLSAAVPGSAAEEPSSDEDRLLRLLSDLDAGAEDIAATWIRDAFHDRS